jgi:hypothetical protein
MTMLTFCCEKRLVTVDVCPFFPRVAPSDQDNNFVMG